MRPSNAIVLNLILMLLAACCGGDTPPPSPPSPPEAPTTVVDMSAVPVADPGSALSTDWYRSGAFMEIYVRAFKDSDGDGIGDFKGVTQSLDYLQDLGIKGIWLMPIMQSYDKDHGYAVSDYRAVESDYGSMADFDELLAEAHKRGIAIILDYVINHSAVDNPIFQDAVSHTNAAYRDWYVWSTAKPSAWSVHDHDPWFATPTGYYYYAFWEGEPDFNLKNPAVVAYHRNAIKFWLNKGVDGFRFDAVSDLVENSSTAFKNQPESYAIMRDMRALLEQYEKRYMVCEAPADAWGFGNACGSSFAFGLNYALIEAANGRIASLEYVDGYVRAMPSDMATFAANHDHFTGGRLYDQVGGNEQRYRLVAAAYLTLPGIPFIYYGEEVGMSNGQGLTGDHRIRSPMSWTGESNAGFTSGTPFRALAANITSFNVAAEQADGDSLLNFYKSLLALRNSHPALAKGSYENSAFQTGVFSFQRILDGDRVLVVLNFNPTAISTTVSNLPADAGLTPLYPASASALIANASGQISISLAARGIAIYRY